MYMIDLGNLSTQSIDLKTPHMICLGISQLVYQVRPIRKRSTPIIMRTLPLGMKFSAVCPRNGSGTPLLVHDDWHAVRLAHKKIHNTINPNHSNLVSQNHNVKIFHKHNEGNVYYFQEKKWENYRICKPKSYNIPTTFISQSNYCLRG